MKLGGKNSNQKNELEWYDISPPRQLHQTNTLYGCGLIGNCQGLQNWCPFLEYDSNWPLDHQPVLVGKARTVGFVDNLLVIREAILHCGNRIAFFYSYVVFLSIHYTCTLKFVVTEYMDFQSQVCSIHSLTFIKNLAQLNF